VQPILIDGRKLASQTLIQILDDPCAAFHTRRLCLTREGRDHRISGCVTLEPVADAVLNRFSQDAPDCATALAALHAATKTDMHLPRRQQPGVSPDGVADIVIA
jgi:hypothetical protein